jgi:hypothetical protein
MTGICTSYRRCRGQTITEFEYLPECEATQASLKKVVKRRPQKDWWGNDTDDQFDPSNEHFALMINHSLCIADDDPRLKGNIRYKGN